MTDAGASDVLIVGAGPTGCAAGIVLARAGIDVAVVDRAHFPRDKTCGDAISNDGMTLVEELGARAELERGPHAVVRRAAAIFPDGNRITRDYDPPGYIIPRYRFDDSLRHALEASGARLLQDRRVSTLRRLSGVVVGADGPDFEWSSKIVIAADGYGSVGLSALGQSAPKGQYLAVSATAYLQGVAFPDGPDTADHYFDRELPFGYGWIFPAVEGTSNVGVYQRADVYARGGRNPKELMSDFVARKAERFAGTEQVGKIRVWSLPIAPRPEPVTAPGLLLAGDAGGFVDPLSGEGIWQALYTGILAGCAARDGVLRGELSASMREQYERTCRRDVSGPSRSKALVQRALAVLVDRKLYRSRLVRSALSWGYRHRALEMTKS